MCILLFTFPVFSFVAFSFSTSILLVGSFGCKNRLPYNLYCVGWDVKHYTQSRSCCMLLVISLVHILSRITDYVTVHYAPESPLFPLPAAAAVTFLTNFSRVAH